MEYINPEIFKAALKVLFNLEPLQLMVMVFGVSVVLLLSVLYVWKHASKEGKL